MRLCTQKYMNKLYMPLHPCYFISLPGFTPNAVQKVSIGIHFSHVYTKIFLRLVPTKSSFSLILVNSSNEAPMCILHQPQTFISEMIFFSN